MTLWHDEHLGEVALFGPMRDGCDELRAVSGYASPGIAYSLLAADESRAVSLSLVVGMVVKDGISLGAHRGFMALRDVDYPGRTDIRYITSGLPVHSKVYVWSKAGRPHSAFVGSANFTANGFDRGYHETLVAADPELCLDLVTSITQRAHAIDDPAVPPSLIVLSTRMPRTAAAPEPRYRPWRTADLPSVDIPLLTTRSQSGVAYGLNWGQRERRHPDQAYLPVPADVARSGFLPPRGVRFTLLAPDGQAMSAVVAQDGDKAIETPESNAILGRFIRSQIGLESGEFITPDALRRAHATQYRLFRIDDDTYAIEFHSGA